MENLEFEVKFFLQDIPSLRREILDRGARSQGKFFEKNLRFEDADKTLIKNRCLLRLRCDRNTTLTFKSPPADSNHQVKVLKELEVQVNDFDTMKVILESLGFHCEQVYEKWRETLVLGDTHFCLDIMPYGNFIEIEGAAKKIRQYAQQLGLQWHRRILLNYLEIFDIIRKKLDLDFSDVTFDNFKDVEFDLKPCLHLIEEGKR